MNNIIDELYGKIYSLEICFDEQISVIEFYCHKNEKTYKISFSQEPKDGYDNIIFVCRRLSYDSWLTIDKLCGDDYIKRNLCVLILSMLKTNLFEIDKEFITKKDLLKILNLYPVIVNLLVSKLSSFYLQSKDFEVKLRADFNILYSAKGPVHLDNYILRKYLTLTSFWEKFGLNYFDIKKLPYDEYCGLYQCLNIDAEMKTKEIKKNEFKNKSNKVRR